MTNAVIIVANNHQDEEMVYPYYRMLEEGYSVQVATPDGHPAKGKYGIPTKGSTIPLLALADAQGVPTTKNIDLVFVPGGDESPDRLRTVSLVKRFVAAMCAEGKLVAAICHGPWVLISAGILKGRRATCIPTMQDDLINCGCEYVNAPVVVDGNIITAPHYRDNGNLMREVIAWVDRHRT